ncbi:MAG TPA: hypothetical protein VGD81_01045, partial [Opitutaceae bacterium]
MKIQLLLLGTLLAVSSPLRSQEILVGAPVAFDEENSPDVLPQEKRTLRPEYPPELSGGDEIGYVIVERYVAANGQSL